MTWEPTFFADSGGCTEVIYSRKDKGKWCQVRADRVLFRTTDHYYSYNDTAARINSLDIQKGSASGKFLFSKDDKRVKNRDPHARRGWDPAGSWRGKALEVTTDFHLNLKGQPDKGATVWFTIGPFDKDCN